jgi:hypothetical protein
VNGPAGPPAGASGFTRRMSNLGTMSVGRNSLRNQRGPAGAFTAVVTAYGRSFADRTGPPSRFALWRAAFACIYERRLVNLVSRLESV